MRKIPSHILDTETRLRLSQISERLEEPYKSHANLRKLLSKKVTQEKKIEIIKEMKALNQEVPILEKEWKELAPTLFGLCFANQG